MLQVLPDWYEHGSRSVLEAEAFGRNLIIDGPGFYLKNDQTILVIRHDPNTDHLWASTSFLPDPVYSIYVWNSPYDQIIFSQIATAPVRKDERTL